MDLLNGTTYRFGELQVDTAQACIRRGGAERHLRQQTFQVLVYLLEHRERLVTKEELLQEIWNGTAVTDDALVQCVVDIRRALGDDSRNPRFVKTIPKVGYRFIAEPDPHVTESLTTVETEEVTSVTVEIEDELQVRKISQVSSALPLVAADQSTTHSLATSRRRRVALVAGIILLLVVVVSSAVYLRQRSRAARDLGEITLAPSAGKKPVAVMYFDNQSGDRDLNWLREGLADMIITDLSRSNNLVVLSRQQLQVLLDRAGHNQADSIQLNEALEVARRTQASIVLLGSFARLGEQIRIDVHLHDARDGQLLTAERLIVDKPDNILSQVDLLALKLASHLGATAEPAANSSLMSAMTNNLEAYRYYSMGVAKAQLLRNEEALALLQKAVALDPEFAMAYARIGYVKGVVGASPEEGKPYLEKAFQFTNRLTEKDKLNITAWYAIVNYDYASAIDAFRNIVANYPLEVEAYRRLALLLKGEERFPEAIEVLKQGLVIDTAAPELYNGLGAIYSDLGRHDEAIAMFQRYVQLAPEEPNSHDSLGLGYQWAGRYDEAIDEYQRALEIKPNFEIAIVHLANTYFQQGRLRVAKDQFARYIRSAPTDFERARGYDCLTVLELRVGDLAAAEGAAKQAQRYSKDPTYSSYLVALKTNNLKEAHRIEAEIERLNQQERGSRASPRYIWFLRGLNALKSGAADAALDNFRQAITHRPQAWNIEAYEDCLANAYLELGRFDDAIADYQRILKLNPNYPLVHYHLAQAYEGKGDNSQARAEYERFLQVWKDADSDVAEVVLAKKKQSV